jgi:hypothetical protein
VLSYASDIAIGYDPDGVDIHFLNSSKCDKRNINTSTEVIEAFNSVVPAGENPMFMKVEKILCPYIKRLQLSLQESSPSCSGNKSHLNLIIITNGDFELESLENTLVHWARLLDGLYVPRWVIGLQFVLVGSSEATQCRFRDLDDTLWKKENVR